VSIRVVFIHRLSVVASLTGTIRDERWARATPNGGCRSTRGSATVGTMPAHLDLHLVAPAAGSVVASYPV
jgi:hypothetical protein